MASGDMRRYRPEIIASIFLVVYTAVRTVVVAQGISPVSSVDWRVFLGIELVTTIPYVWAMGDLMRRAARQSGTSPAQMRRRIFAMTVAASSLLAPYVYLAVYGSLATVRGAWVFIALLLVFTAPALVRLYMRLKVSRNKRKHV